MNDFYMTLRSTDSKNFYPTNNSKRFIVQLDEQIELNGHWKVGLVEIGTSKGFNVSRDVYVYSNICGNNIVGGSRTSLLRRFFLKRGKNDVVFSTPMYINVTTNSFHSIEIDLKSREGQDLPLATDTVITIVLHFRKPFFFL